MRDLVFGVVLAVAFIIMMGIGFIIKSRVPKTITNSIGMQMVLISSGTFMMGSPPSDKGSLRNERQHEVTLSQDYYLGAFEVTQDQYEQVMGKNPSFFPSIGNMNSSNHPVERVSWFDAKNFCRKLSELPEEKKAGRVYRLPTEAEWEYACRAGSQTSFSFGEDLGSLFHFAWFGGNSRETQPVGQKKPNAWGLYDMHGNVWEWCSDLYSDEYSKGAVTDPRDSDESTVRVYRGGSWKSNGADCRSARRAWRHPVSRYNFIGFRVALSSPGIPQSPEADK